MYLHILGHHIKRSCNVILYNYESTKLNRLISIYAEYGKIEEVKKCVKFGVNLTENYEVLRRACEGGYMSVVEYLVENGCAINVGDEDSPLSLAAEYGNLDIIKYLEQHGADVTIYKYGEIALEHACKNGYTEMVRYLLDRGVDIDYAEWYIDDLIEENRIEILKILVEKGLDIGPAAKRSLERYKTNLTNQVKKSLLRYKPLKLTNPMKKLLLRCIA